MSKLMRWRCLSNPLVHYEIKEQAAKLGKAEGRREHRP